MTEKSNEAETCIFCDWPQEWDTGELCILHSYEFWDKWRPLAEFGGIAQ